MSRETAAPNEEPGQGPPQPQRKDWGPHLIGKTSRRGYSTPFQHSAADEEAGAEGIPPSRREGRQVRPVGKLVVEAMNTIPQ